MLRLIIAPHEEQSLNTSKKASKKDQCSTWLGKKQPKQTLHSKSQPTILALSQTKCWGSRISAGTSVMQGWAERTRCCFSKPKPEPIQMWTRALTGVYSTLTLWLGKFNSIDAKSCKKQRNKPPKSQPACQTPCNPAEEIHITSKWTLGITLTSLHEQQIKPAHRFFH